jgi:hypothetical protein
MTYDGGRWYHHEIGLTYDSRNHKLGDLDSLIRLMPTRRITLQNAMTYDGYTHHVSYNDMLANYDMGCLALTGSYRQQTHEYLLELTITAFGGQGGMFGSGRFGQQFSTAQGLTF